MPSCSKLVIRVTSAGGASKGVLACTALIADWSKTALVELFDSRKFDICPSVPMRNTTVHCGVMSCLLKDACGGLFHLLSTLAPIFLRYSFIVSVSSAPALRVRLDSRTAINRALLKIRMKSRPLNFLEEK